MAITLDGVKEIPFQYLCISETLFQEALYGSQVQLSTIFPVIISVVGVRFLSLF